MRNTEGRRLKLFCMLSDELFHTLDDLAEELGVSKRTVFFDLKELETFIQSAGAELLPKKGSGYVIDVKRRDIFRDTVETIKTRFIYNSCQNCRDEKFARFYDVIALMITADHYITNEQISERLYLTKSSIQIEFGLAQYVLSTYDLEINRQNKDAPMIVGKELNIRLCSLQLNEYYSGINLINESLPVKEPFFFKNERGYVFTHIRRMVIQVLYNHHFGYCSNQFLKLIKYLYIARSRCQDGHRPQTDEKDRAFLMRLPLYPIACEIFAQLDGMEQDEEEILAFTQVLLLFSSPDNRTPPGKQYGDLFAEADALREKIEPYLAAKHDLPANSCEEIRRLRSSYLCVILCAIRLGCERQFVYPTKSDQNGYFSNLMCAKLACDIAHYINQTYQTELSIYYVALLHEEILAEIGRIQYPKKPLKAIVCSIYGIENARIISSRIVSGLPRSVGLELVPEFPAFQTCTLDVDLDCDFLISHDPGLRYRSSCPLFRVSLVPKREEIDAIADYALMHQANLMALWKDYLPTFTVYKVQGIDDMEIFLDQVATKYISGKERTDKICQQLVESAQYTASAHVAWVFLDHSDAKERVFDIYSFDRPAKWPYDSVQNVIVLSVSFQQNPALLRLVSDFSYVAMTYPEVWNQMVTSGSPDPVLQQILKTM